jgi:CRP/FNR family cyclic AMP-dependent transcriptional regulator
MIQAPDVERLREVGLFGGLDDAALQMLARAHEVVEVPPGDSVFREGEPGREMFVVLEGEIELSHDVRGVAVHTASVSKNDWFGEMSMLDVLPRSTTARVVAHARLLRLTAHDLDVLYRREPKAYTLLVLNIAREMSRRLRLADALLADMRVAQKRT